MGDTRRNMPDLSAMLNPRDRRIIDDSPATNWIPKDPRDLLLPFINEDTTPTDRASVEFRRKKAKEVYDGYGEIIQRCTQMEEEIEAQCKNVVVTLIPSKHLRIMEAIKRVFGTDGTKMTFAMYKAAVRAFSEISKKNIPDPVQALNKKR